MLCNYYRFNSHMANDIHDDWADNPENALNGKLPDDIRDADWLKQQRQATPSRPAPPAGKPPQTANADRMPAPDYSNDPWARASYGVSNWSPTPAPSTDVSNLYFPQLPVLEGLTVGG